MKLSRVFPHSYPLFLIFTVFWTFQSRPWEELGSVGSCQLGSSEAAQLIGRRGAFHTGRAFIQSPIDTPTDDILGPPGQRQAFCYHWSEHFLYLIGFSNEQKGVDGHER